MVGSSDQLKGAHVCLRKVKRILAIAIPFVPILPCGALISERHRQSHQVKTICEEKYLGFV